MVLNPWTTGVALAFPDFLVWIDCDGPKMRRGPPGNAGVELALVSRLKWVARGERLPPLPPPLVCSGHFFTAMLFPCMKSAADNLSSPARFGIVFPDMLQPPKGCAPTIAPVQLSISKIADGNDSVPFRASSRGSSK